MNSSDYERMTAPTLRLEFYPGSSPSHPCCCRAITDEIEVYYTVGPDGIYFMLMSTETESHSEPIVLN